MLAAKTDQTADDLCFYGQHMLKNRFSCAPAHNIQAEKKYIIRLWMENLRSTRVETLYSNLTGATSLAELVSNDHWIAARIFWIRFTDLKDRPSHLHCDLENIQQKNVVNQEIIVYLNVIENIPTSVYWGGYQVNCIFSDIHVWLHIFRHGNLSDFPATWLSSDCLKNAVTVLCN